jgi:TRAP-type mannitol/chloroaromatic compound transport system permease large subunit
MLSGLALGALLAPMNGSVGASVAALSRIVQPRLLARGIAAVESLAVVCVASTLGVVVPPSLVLILFGDTMMRAHTEALNATGRMARIINTQDVFRGALGPAALFLGLSLVVAWWSGRRAPVPVSAGATRASLGPAEWVVAGATLLLIVGLLAAVTAGYIYAVEAAAAGAFALALFGAATRGLNAAAIGDVLRTTMAVTGALFALFVAATTFTLVFRAFGTDRVLAAMIVAIPGGPLGATIAVLLLLGLCGLVLDAFEIILVIVPLLMPPLLVRVPDAVWASALAMLALQASFLVPPFGYAVMMARAPLPEHLPLGAVARALAPFLCAQAVVLALTLALPARTHLAAPDLAADMSLKPVLDEDEVRRQLQLLPAPDEPDQ